MSTRLVSQSFRFGILGTGQIAAVFAEDVAASELVSVTAVASRTLESAEAFSAAWSTGEEPMRAYGSYQRLLEADDVDAVYLALPHAMHAEWAERALRAGRHVLVEKPMALDEREAVRLIESARAAELLIAEALMYRLHPQTAQLLELIGDGVVGEVQTVRASYTFSFPGLPDTHRLIDPGLGGGALLDVGVYPASLALLVACAASGHAVAPVDVSAVARRHSATAVETYTAALLQFPNQLLAELACGFELAVRDELAIYGSTGTLRVPEPAWLYEQARGGRPSELLIEREGQPVEHVVVPAAASSYRLEAEAFAHAFVASTPPTEVPELPLAHTVATHALLDRWSQVTAGTRRG